jgi:hypothetical protein
MERQEMERIARATLRELGVPKAELTIVAIDGTPGYWKISIQGRPQPLKIRCGEGSSAQWVRNQIFDQYTSQ